MKFSRLSIKKSFLVALSLQFLASSTYVYAMPVSTDRSFDEALQVSAAPPTEAFGDTAPEAVDENANRTSSEPALQSQEAQSAPMPAISDVSTEAQADSSDSGNVAVSEGRLFGQDDAYFGRTPVLGDALVASAELPKADTLLRASPASRLTGTITGSPRDAATAADTLTREILFKEMELEKFNLHYKQHVAYQGRWRGWRYASFQEANGGLNLAGGIVGTIERTSHFRHPGFLNVDVQEEANLLGMIGSWIGAGAAAMELGINGYHEWQAHKLGFSPRAARQHVIKLRDEINDLLAQRDEALKVEGTSPALKGHVQMDDLEGNVLRDVRDLAILEYERFHINARRSLALQNCLYTFDLFKYSLNAVGSYFAYMSLHQHQRIWNMRAGVMWDISGPLYMVGPIASRVIAKGVGEMNRRSLASLTKDAEATQIAKLDADEKALEACCQSGICTPDQIEAPVSRSAFYNENDKTFHNELDDAEKSRQKAKLVATQNIGSGIFVGGCKLAQGILFTVPGTAFRGKGKTSTRVTNYDLATASIVGLPATTYAMLDTLRIQVKGELARHKLAEQHKLPNELIDARLKQIDEMQARLALAH